MKIVKPHHTWDTEGYLGNAAGTPFNGIFWEWIGDREGDEFILEPVEIGRDYLIGRCPVLDRERLLPIRRRQDRQQRTRVKVKAARDNVLAGSSNLLCGHPARRFIATWNDPLTGKCDARRCDRPVCADAGFTVPYHGRRPGSCQPRNWIRSWQDVLVQGRGSQSVGSSESCRPLHDRTLGWGTTGWGPWAAVVGPITSAADTGAPTDSVIPGPVQNLVVTGANGNFVADWDDPATGNLTLDDHRHRVC